MEIFLDNMYNSFLKTINKLELVLIHVKTKDRFSIRFSHVIMSTISHYENRVKNWVENWVIIQKLPNIGHDLNLGLAITIGAREIG